MKNVYLLLAAVLLHVTVGAQTTLIPYSTSWKYLAGTTRPANWQTSGFDDAAWLSGNAELGYGDGDEATTVSFGGDAANKFITTYFRKTITVADPSVYQNLTLNVERDDGVVIYINGTEVGRDNMPTGTISHSTLSSSNVEDATVSFTIAAGTLVAGTNTIAVEMHQSSASSTDLSFQLELVGNPAAAAVINYGGAWKYLVTPSAPASTWKDASFNDGTWTTGNAELGYGDGGEATVIGFGPDANNKYTTTYFRRNFTVTNLADVGYFTINAIRDDGIVIYVNGTEVARDNMPAGAVSYNTFASSAIGGAGETTPVSFTILPSYFVEGSNTIAVELHQSDLTSSDVSFNLQLVSNPTGSASITRGPYLQMGNETAITIRWRTNVPTDSRVTLGTAHGTYPIEQTIAGLRTEHEVRLAGLTPDTRYFYTIGSSSYTLEATNNNYFRTVPPATANRKFRFSVFGDCGRNDLNYRSLSISHYLNYLSNNGLEASDAWILLGDNAYTNGTDAEYTSGFFTPFQNNLLKNHKLYPAPGNHDYYSSSTTSRTGPYYQNFTMPTNGECGGVASGTEAFYSFDIGNVHFLSLDSYGQETGNTKMYDTLGAQVTWIKQDLAANTKPWVVAYFHHPPYTMGSHNSDSESDLVAIRFRFIRILERLGVDLVLAGHSHDYERSYLLQGHYGNESSFDPATHALSSSTARYDNSSNSCPYTTTTNQMNHGTVYVVAGSSGADGGVQAGYPHNAFPFSVDDGGMVYFEVEGNRLDAKFLRRDGSIGDQFTIMQDVARTESVNVITGNSVTLTASWVGNYLWSNGATTRSITVTPVSGASSYSVSDASGSACLTDVFNVTTTGVLPVVLKDFSASLKDNGVHLNWSTQTETGNRDFTVERSPNAADYDAIGVVAGSGNSAIEKRYSFVDRTPLYGDNYYRLKQSDWNNRVSYSPVRRIFNPIYRFELIKVRTAERNVMMEVMCGKEDEARLQVFDLSGRAIVNRQIKLANGQNTVVETLEKGSYIIQLTNSQGRVLSRKVII